MSKTAILKLGGKCNLQCKHCHCAKTHYKFNPQIIDYIVNNQFTNITFCGGEPTLYMDVIKKIVAAVPDNIQYKLVTNGTTLSYELAEWFNKHNFKIVISYDGNNGSRDRRLMQCWDEYAKIKKQGVASLFSPENQDIFKFQSQLEFMRERYMPNAVGASVWLNFPHQTTENPNDETNRDLAKKYCQIIAINIESDFIKYKKGQRNNLSALGMAFNKWIRKNAGKGVKCFNEHKMNIALDGRFLLCPYGEKYVGNINDGVDWTKVESCIPARCKDCPQWPSCMNTCITNITDNECYISKVMYKHFYKLLSKYNVSYEELEQNIRW